MKIGNWFLMLAIIFASLNASASEGDSTALILIDDATVHVEKINVPYIVKANTEFGSAWIAIGNDISVDGRKVPEGEAQIVSHGKTLNFTCALQQQCELIVVAVKAAEQDLTITTNIMDVKGGFNDASMRNKTLIVAVSPLSFRDILDVGDEDHPIMKKPVAIKMMRGEVKWLAEGMHNVTNLLPDAGKYVLIEW